MAPRHFYTANILSALVWAPAHIFPGVLLAMALRFTGASAEERTILVIAGLIIATLIILATHSYFKGKRSYTIE
jgi:membrane protein DedA with SNARE-associated domain